MACRMKRDSDSVQPDSLSEGNRLDRRRGAQSRLQHCAARSRNQRPTELAGNVFDFAEKLLANQREFVTSVLDVAEPYVAGKQPTKKTATTKSTAA